MACHRHYVEEETIMTTRAWMTVTAAAGVLLPLLGGAANAAQQTAFAIQGGNDTKSNVTYTPGGAGGLSIFGTNEFLIGKLGQGMDNDTTVLFSNMQNGAYSINGSGVFDQVLNPGADTSSFVVTDNTTHTVLLSGTFGTADLVGSSGASSGNITLQSNDVTYTGGTFFPSGFLPTGGALSIEFTSTSPFAANGTNVQPFEGVDGVTFSGINNRGSNGGGVPEPASVAPIGVGALSLLGLMIRKRRGSRK